MPENPSWQQLTEVESVLDLDTVVEGMFKKAGFKEVKINHTSGATAIFSARVPEEIIQRNPGLRSIKALRKYERVSVEIQRTISE